MFWSTINFSEIDREFIPLELQSPELLAFVGSVSGVLQDLHDKILYQMQHDGVTIYLEKVLNEWFEVSGYNPSAHESTKKVYIGDGPTVDDIFVFQNEEEDLLFLEDDDELDIFLDEDQQSSYAFIIFIPDTYSFEELNVRALVDSYRFFGYKYEIQTYTL